MSFVQLCIAILELLRAADGKYAKSAPALTAVALTNDVNLLMDGSGTVSARDVVRAVIYLKELELVTVTARKAGLSGSDAVRFRRFDLTGTASVLLDSLDSHARAEGKKSTWMWSVLRKAGDKALDTLIAFGVAGLLKSMNAASEG